MINENIPSSARTGDLRCDVPFPRDFIERVRDAAELVIGVGAFSEVEYGDLGQQLLVIKVPPVQLGLRFFTGIQAHITKDSYGRPTCTITDPWIRYKEQIHRHPHMSNTGLLCHDSNDVVEALRSGDYVNAVVMIVAKVGTHTPGGEHHVPFGIRVCSKHDPANPTCWINGDGEMNTSLSYCNVCRLSVCTNHAEICSRCRATVCSSCAVSTGTSTRCFTTGDPTEKFLCGSCALSSDVTCGLCGYRDSRTVRCDGCKDIVPRGCAKRCYYHNTTPAFASSVTTGSGSGFYCAKCARSDDTTARQTACYDCVPGPDVAGAKCGYIKHAHARVKLHSDKISTVKLEIAGEPPVEVNACAACYDMAVQHAENIVMLRAWVRGRTQEVQQS